MSFFQSIIAQSDSTKQRFWKIGGGFGLDFSQLLYINPKVGAGDNRLGIGGNISLFANYKHKRIKWQNSTGLTFGVIRIGRGEAIPFQKSIDEFRVNSVFNYSIKDESSFNYAFDLHFLTLITPTYDGNYLSRINADIWHPIAEFFSPATLTLSPGFSYHTNQSYGDFTVLLSPASLKMTFVTSDSIAMMGLHGNPFEKDVTREEFIDNWKTQPDGEIDGGFYAHNYIQLGATLKFGYKHKLWPFKINGKTKHRMVVSTLVNLYTNYMRDPQNVDVEWIANIDLHLFKGLSLSLMTNLFYDHDVFVLVDRDGDINTGVNGYESTGRRVSFFEQILIKYNFLF